MTDYNVNVKYNVDASGLGKAGTAADKLKTGLKASTGEATALQGKMLAMGAAVGTAMVAAVGAVATAVKSAINDMDELSKAAQRAGVSIEAMSTLNFVGDQSGASPAAMAKGLRELAQEALDGGKKLSQLGISVNDATGKMKNADVLLKEVATKFKGYSNDSREAALAMELFGAKVGPELIPLLNGGAAGIEELQQRARDLGLEVDEVSGKSAEAFNDSLDQMAGLAKGFANDIAKELLPGLSALAEHLVDNGIKARKSSSGFAEGFSWIVKWVIKAGIGIKTFAQLVGASMGFVVDVVGKVSKAFLNFGGIIETNMRVAKAALSGNFSEAATIAQNFQKQQLAAITSLPQGLASSFATVKDQLHDIAMEGATQISLLDTEFKKVADSAEDAANASSGISAPNLSGKGGAASVNREAAKAAAESAKALQELAKAARDVAQQRIESNLLAKAYSDNEMGDGVGGKFGMDAYRTAVETIRSQGGIARASVSVDTEGAGVDYLKPAFSPGEELQQKFKDNKAALEQWAKDVEIALDTAINANLTEARIAMNETFKETNANLEHEKQLQNDIAEAIVTGQIYNQESLNTFINEANRMRQEDADRVEAARLGLLGQIEAQQKLNEEIKKRAEQNASDIKKVEERSEYFKETMSGIGNILGNSLQEAFETGKLNFKKFLSDIASMLVASGIKKLIESIFSGGDKSGGGSGGGGWMQAIGTVISGWFGGGQAKGGGWNNGVQFFANGGVVNGVTPFGMGNGKIGVAGEAGPEAIMPLARGKNGKLGVAASGGAGNTYVINNSVTVNSNGDSKEDAEKASKEMDKMLDMKMKRFISNQQRPGNMLNPTVKAF